MIPRLSLNPEFIDPELSVVHAKEGACLKLEWFASKMSAQGA
jgi:hypothetical protein